MRPHRLRHVVPSAVLAASLFALSVPAFASESLEVQNGQTVWLAGTLRFKKVTVRNGGTVRVRPVAGGSSPTGALTLKAEEIVIEAGGTIDASGAGYDGTAGDGAAPACCTDAGGKAVTMGAKAAPGGGGGSGGKGAPGCTADGAAVGAEGAAYPSDPVLANPGAAGGASFFPAGSASVSPHGGRGGGAVSLEAATIQIDGKVLADGAPGVAYGGVGSGGGAGGFISVEAFTLSGSGMLSAKGGAGAVGSSGIGGGGGGGIIRTGVNETMPANSFPERDINGGASGPTGCAAGADGQIYGAAAEPQRACIDADGDGDPSPLCGGKDCDDSDPTLHGGTTPAIEICDGEDNDCNGDVDDNLVKDACEEGQVCEAGTCTNDSSGASGGPSGDTTAPYLDYRGACTIAPARPTPTGLLAATLLGLLAAFRPRKRRPR